MPKITAWQCPKTRKVFLTEEAYMGHLRVFAAENIREKRRRAILANLDQHFAEMRKCTDTESLAQWIEANAEVFLVNIIRNGFSSDMKKSLRHVIDFRIYDISIGLTWVDGIATTHSAPIGKCSKWSHPYVYARGFSGEIRFSMSYETTKGNPDLSGLSAFRGSGINTGTGSGGVTRYNSSITLYADDWTSMAVAHHLLMAG